MPNPLNCCFGCGAHRRSVGLAILGVDDVPSDLLHHQTSETPEQYANANNTQGLLAFCGDCVAGLEADYEEDGEHGDGEEDDGEEDDGDDGSPPWQCSFPDCRKDLTIDDAVHYYLDGCDYCVDCAWYMWVQSARLSQPGRHPSQPANQPASQPASASQPETPVAHTVIGCTRAPVAAVLSPHRPRAARTTTPVAHTVAGRTRAPVTAVLSPHRQWAATVLEHTRVRQAARARHPAVPLRRAARAFVPARTRADSRRSST